MLDVKDLRSGYGAIQILQGIDFSVEPGEIVAVLGSNGAGKTTLNRTLSGMATFHSGSVTFEGRSISRLAPAEIVLSGLIHVPEGRKTFPNLTVRENLLLGAYLRGKSKSAQTLDYVLTAFPRLRERLGQLVGTMSGGEQQMVAIGRGLMSEPRLLILDEPSLGLSPLLTEEMFAMIKRLNTDGLSILLVEQNVFQSLGVAHRAYVIENGRIALSGKAETLMEDARLKAAFLGM